MKTVKISSLSRDLVGNIATVRAEILEDMGRYTRISDTVELEIEGGAHMSDDALKDAVMEAYSE